MGILADMDPQCEQLLRVFAAKLADAHLSGPYVDVVVSAAHCTVTATHRGTTVILHFLPDECADLLSRLRDDSADLWGSEVPPVEGAARLLTIHLDESLAPYDDDLPQRWTYQLGGFLPIPPWEAHARAHR
jgi:hypothetical protein